MIDRAIACLTEAGVRSGRPRVDSLPAAGSFPDGSFSPEAHNEARFRRFMPCRFRRLAS